MRKLLTLGFVAVILIFSALITLGNWSLNDDKKQAADDSAKNPGVSISFPQIEEQKIAEALLQKTLSQTTKILGENATKKLADDLSKEIVEKNPNGPGPLGSQKISVPQAEEIVADFLQKGVDNFNYEELKPAIADSDLNIVGDDPAALARYYKNFFEILSGNFNLGPAESDPQNSLDILVSVYENYIKKFYLLETPEKFADIQKQQISLLAAQRNIYRLMRDYENDPLKAVLAMKALDTVKQETADLYTKLAKTVAKI